MEPPIYYHEDFYRQIELMPEENYFKLLRDTENKSIPDSDYGFIKIKERNEYSIKTEDKQIKFKNVNDTLAPFIINYYCIVETGYGSHTELKINTVAFGFERIAIFIEKNKNDIIKNIWLCQSPLLPNDFSGRNLILALDKLGKEYGLILIDWDEEVAVRLTSLKSIHKYLTEAFGFNL